MNRIVSVIASAAIVLTSTASGTFIKDTDEVSAETASFTYTAEDLQNLQDFLLAKPTEKDLTGKPYDLNGDDRWDVFDLSIIVN